MDVRYWNRRSRDYDQEVLSSFHADRRGVITRRLRQLAGPERVVTDFGCGVGKYVPTLSRRFRHVYAIDFAQKLLDAASERCHHLSNVRFLQGDLARTRFAIRKAHVGICQNVLISPERGQPQAILRNIRRHLVKDGELLLLVPSTESALYCNQRLVEWNRREGARGKAVTRDVEMPDNALTLLDGVIEREGVPTRHYLREEAAGTLSEAGFHAEHIEKVEYDWDSEFQSPPAWLSDPYPWDWLIRARKAA